jgi:hypothetical protein
MTIPRETAETALGQIGRFCDERVPPDARDTVRLEHELHRNTITIVECRAPWRADFGPEWTRSPIAQLRYDDQKGTWSLYWRDSRERWLAYEGPPPADRVAPLLAEIDADPHGCFWG